MVSISDLIGTIKHRQEVIKNSLANGLAVNIESYQRLVGTYQGLEEVLEMIDNQLNEEEHDPDDRD